MEIAAWRCFSDAGLCGTACAACGVGHAACVHGDWSAHLELSRDSEPELSRRVRECGDGIVCVCGDFLGIFFGEGV